jgi:replicative DNA helicase
MICLNRYINNEEYIKTNREELLGIILKDPSVLREVKRVLNKDHFGAYGYVYETMIKLDRKEIFEFKGMINEMPDEALLLHTFYNTAYTTQRSEELIQNLQSYYLHQQLQSICNSIQSKLMDDTSPDEVYTLMQSELDSLGETKSGSLVDSEIEVDNYVKWIYDIHNDPSSAFGIMTGIPELDKITTGFHRSDLIVVGARTSMGKSAFMIEMVLRLAQNGYKTAIFSLEMTRGQIYMRMLANLMRANLEALRTGQYDKRLLPEIEKYKDLVKKIYIDDTRGVDSEYIVDTMRTLKRENGLDFVVVDYLQDIKEKGEHNDNQGSALGRICRKLRTGAKLTDCAVMALSQVTRMVEDRKDKRPTVADLSGSTGIETSADVIAMLYRDDYYNPNVTMGEQSIIEVNFAKHRNGKVGKVELLYDKSCQRIYPIERYKQQ